MRVLYIFVEGNTDKALVEALLQKRLEFKSYDSIEKMPEMLSRQVPRYPKPNGSLTIESRPLFMYRENVAVMVCITNGKGGIAADLAGRLKVVSFSQCNLDDSLIIGIIQDRDFRKSNNSIKNEIAVKLKEKQIDFQDDRIYYDSKSYECHFHILPVNRSGAVESILLDLLEESHKKLNDAAKTYRETIEEGDEFATYRAHWATSKENQKLYADKVQVGAVSAVLKPDSSPAFMVKDKLFNHINLGALCQNEEISKLIDFLNEMIDNSHIL